MSETTDATNRLNEAAPLNPAPAHYAHDPRWRLRRLLAFGSVGYIGLMIGVVVITGSDTVAAQNMVTIGLPSAMGIVASYHGWASWQELNEGRR